MTHARLAALASIALLVGAASGCLQEGSPDATNSPPPTAPALGPAVPLDFVDPLIMNHDHSDAKLHNLAYHMVETAHHPLGGNLAKSSGAHAIEIQNGYLFVAAYGASVDVAGGVYIFDIKADPEKPQLVGQFNMPGNVGGDRSMEATDDGNFVVLGAEPISCAGHVNPFAPGLYLIDATDKTRPLIADYVPGSIHSVIVHRVKDADYAFAGGGVYKIQKGAPRATLVRVGSINMGHDGAAYDDPVLGKALFYAAHDNARVLYVYDISDPAKIVELGKWKPEDDSPHYVHAVAVDWVEGHRLIVVESEDWRDKPSPLWVLNGDDLSDIDLIGNWTNPGQKPANAGRPSSPPGSFGGQLIFSTHNPRLENGVVYMAHYHGGVWVLNVSSMARATEPEVLGYYIPHDNNGGFVPRSGEGAYPKPNACGFDLTDVPNVFDVEVLNGIVYAADLHTGMYAMKLDPTLVPGAAK